jgi:hypothetical protein
MPDIVIDSIVQAKYTTYQTDTKLRIAVITQCWKFGEHLDLHNDYGYHTDGTLLKKILILVKGKF